MQNWEQTPYEHGWYGNMFSTAQIKTEPQEPVSQPSQLEQYLTSLKQQNNNEMTPSPKTDSEAQSFFGGGNNGTSLGFNPLTPPGLPNVVIPPMSHYHHTMQSNLTANANNTPTPTNTPPMDCTPPKSPNFLTDSNNKDMDHDMLSNSSEDGKDPLESEDDETINMPIYNSHGKMKNYKCKNCGFTAITKVCFWTHMRDHMKPEKILQCPKCPFVTELKHHLEYHTRKHKNIKPFQCDKCNYSCVNKSMLNSHRKSHSSVYQYRCANCDYATKYCHSFKLHLRKYDHKPGMVLDEEGVPNPSVVIDVYGTRRGPKMKTSVNMPPQANKRNVPELKPELRVPFPPLPASPAKSNASSNSEHHNNNQMLSGNPSGQSLPSLLPPLVQSMLQQQHMGNFFPYWNLNLQMLAAQQQLAQMSPTIRGNLGIQQQQHHQQQHQHQQHQQEPNTDSNHEFGTDDGDEGEEDEEEEEVVAASKEQKDKEENLPSAAIDLSAQSATPSKEIEVIKENSEEEETNTNTPSVTSTSILRRKGRVLKLETASSNQSEVSEDTEDPQTPSSSIEEPKEATTISRVSPTTIPATLYDCKYCDIFFKDAIIYTIHMGYHSCDDAFKCNMCGEKCETPVGLFVHMARHPHS